MTNQEETIDIRIAGFKSIKEIHIALKRINIIVGANGSGKSNLLSFFKILRAFVDGNLNKFFTYHGGAEDILFNGRKVTDKMGFFLENSIASTGFIITPTANNELKIEFEPYTYPDGRRGWHDFFSDSNTIESGSDYDTTKIDIKKIIESWQIYHFHDTSKTAGMRHYEIIQDDRTLREDAANIAPFLLRIKNESPDNYAEIINAIRHIVPFFEDFLLEPRMWGPAEKVNLSWKQKDSDYPMQPYHLSDGTLRFICLAVALLQPNPPAIIIIDEPELGLHPFAIAILAELIQIASDETQIIISTQSPLLIDYFEVEDIIVARREDGASTFTRLEEEDFILWLEDDYSLGELLIKDIIEGGPVYE